MVNVGRKVQAGHPSFDRILVDMNTQCDLLLTEADIAMRQMYAKGALLITTDELISGAADHRLQNVRSNRLQFSSSALFTGRTPGHRQRV
jgi:hypothetical protein